MAFRNPRSVVYNPTRSKIGRMNRKNRRFYPKKKFGRFIPLAPRNTTSFIIRSKESGGITSLVSPCPATPAILATPRFSLLKERVVDMAKEEWGVDCYGSMKGLIFCRSPTGSRAEGDHELSRFEIVCPSNGKGQSCLLESKVDDQDRQIARLEEDNLSFKGRVFLMENEMGEIRRRLKLLESDFSNNNSSNNNNYCDDEEINL